MDMIKGDAFTARAAQRGTIPFFNRQIGPRIVFITCDETIFLTDETTVGSSLTPCDTTDPYAAWYGPVGITGDSGLRGPVGITGHMGLARITEAAGSACHGVLTICCSVTHPGPKGVTVKEYFESIGQTKLLKQISRQPKQRSLPQYSHNRRRKNFR